MKFFVPIGTAFGKPRHYCVPNVLFRDTGTWGRQTRTVPVKPVRTVSLSTNHITYLQVCLDYTFSVKEIDRAAQTPPPQCVVNIHQCDVTIFEKIEESKTELKELNDCDGSFKSELLLTNVKLENTSETLESYENHSTEYKQRSSIKVEAIGSLYEITEDWKVW